MKLSNTEVRYAICVNNEGYELDLEPLKVYPMLPDESEASDLDLIRMIDESDEDYLYPASYFVPVSIPLGSEEALLQLLNAKLGFKP